MRGGPAASESGRTLRALGPLRRVEKRGEIPAQVGLRGLENYAKMTGVLVERSESVSTEVRVWTLTFDRELEDVD